MGREVKATERHSERVSARVKTSAMESAMKDRDGTTFIAIPHVVFDSPGYRQASPGARALLFDLISCLFRSGKTVNGCAPVGDRGLPNGGLLIDRKRLRLRGWKSISTINDKVKELVACGLLCMTLQGGNHRPSLYAVTWLGLATAARKYTLDIDPDKWNSVHRGAYLRPAPPQAPASKPDRTLKARAARKLGAEVRRNATSRLSDSAQGHGFGLSDSQQPPTNRLSGSPVPPTSNTFGGLSDSPSIEGCHLPAQRRVASAGVPGTRAVVGAAPTAAIPAPPTAAGGTKSGPTEARRLRDVPASIVQAGTRATAAAIEAAVPAVVRAGPRAVGLASGNTASMPQPAVAAVASKPIVAKHAWVLPESLEILHVSAPPIGETSTAERATAADPVAAA
jgi:hypothetical protein